MTAFSPLASYPVAAELYIPPPPPIGFHGSFAALTNELFLDWGTEDYHSFLSVSQQDDAVDTKEQTPYIYTFLEETTQSNISSEGATMTGYWDWANDTSSPRVAEPIEIYKFQSNALVCARKHKMRGRGRQLQLQFDSETGKNFNLLGWAVYYVHNQQQ